MSEETASFSAADAAARIDEVGARVDDDRAKFNSMAFPLGLFGVISLIAGAVGAVGTASQYGTFWAVAGPVGGLTIAVWAWWTEVRWPFRRPHGIAMALTSVSLVVIASFAGFSGPDFLPFVAVGAAYIVFGMLSDSRHTLAVAVAILIITVAAALGLPVVGQLWGISIAVGIAQLLGAAAELRDAR